MAYCRKHLVYRDFASSSSINRSLAEVVLNAGAAVDKVM